MIDFKEQLITLIQKEPIVSTFDSRTIATQPEEVIANYNHHTETYVELNLICDLERRFINKIVHRQTPKACLVARYGYGKTTVAIGLWQACRNERILAVPPAGYTSIAEIASTTYSWVRNALRDNHSADMKLNELYSTYLQSSTDELAKLVSRRSGRSYEHVMAILTDPALEGSLRLDPPTTNIVLFLEALTHIVTANGYSGLAIFVDEFQQLLGKAGAEVLTSLRSLIWGLRTRKIPFGLVITMDPNSERILGERAGDILHRIKDDDLYLDFQQIHNSDFPRLLWERYARQMNLKDLTFRVVDKPALEALGQISERGDLSNGPRTVANVFRRIATFYADTGNTYTPLQLIDDFLTGAVIFDGDANTIASLVTEFSGYAYFRRTSAHLAALKLLAAFPGGCTEEIASKYGLLEPFKEITSDLRGDIVTLLPNGYALIDLQRVGKPLNRLSIILKKYWMQITNAEEYLSENVSRFAHYIVPQLFPTGAGQSESWIAESSPSLSVDNSYTQIFAGRLHARHPLRRVKVHVCTQEPVSHRDGSDVDIQLVFVLHSKFRGAQKAFRQKDNHLIFHLDLGRAPENGLPVDLRIIEHNLSPQPSTPSVLLNVAEFVEKEISQATLKQTEKAQVDYTLGNVRRWLVNFLFDEHLLTSLDAEVTTPGYRGMRDILFRECERRFPRYKSLITSSTWRENLTLYKKILMGISIAERRGIDAIEGSKSEIANLFGQRSHAGFESKIRVQYPSLLDIVWTGERGTLTFTPHPVEAQILTYLNDEESDYGRVLTLCRSEGYSKEEIAEIISLLETRGQIKVDGKIIHKVGIVSIGELRHVGSELASELQNLYVMLPTSDVLEFLEKAQAISMIDSDDEIARQRAHANLVFLTEASGELRKRAYSALVDVIERQRNDLTALMRALDKPVKDSTEIVSFKSHVDGARKEFEEQKLSVQKAAEKLRTSLQSTRNKIAALDAANVSDYIAKEAVGIQQRQTSIQGLQKKAKAYVANIQLIANWYDFIEHFAHLRSNIDNLVIQLGESEPTCAHLSSTLYILGEDIREELSHQGIRALEHINNVRHRLDDIAKEYDRSLSEREAVFEQEKAHLDASISAMTGKKKVLRSKYQISKHDESYQDLCLEALSIVNGAVGSLSARIQLLDAGIKKSKSVKNPISIDRKSLRLLLNKVLRSKGRLTDVVEDKKVPVRSLWDDLAQAFVETRSLLEEAEASLDKQQTLPLASEALLSHVAQGTQDLRSLINVESNLAILPLDSELFALLKLYLEGEISIVVNSTSDHPDDNTIL